MNKIIKVFLAGTIISIVNLIVFAILIRNINDMSALLFYLLLFGGSMLAITISYIIIRCFADIKNKKECLLYSVFALVIHRGHLWILAFVEYVLHLYEPGWDVAFASIFTHVGLIVLIIYFLIRLGIARLKKK